MTTPSHHPEMEGGHHPPRAWPLNRGFTLMEMMGVLAILTMTAAVLTPSLAQKLGRMRGAHDAAEIAAAGAALRQYVALHQEIPGYTSWVACVASTLGVSSDEVRYSVPGEPSTARAYLIHPSFTPANESSGAIPDPIWTQHAGGAVTVTEARVMILSVHRPGLSLPVTSGIAASAEAFDALWNWNLDPTTQAPPTGWPSVWSRNGSCLHIERIQLEPLFHRVTFSNIQHGLRDPFVQVDGGRAIGFGLVATYDGLYLDGSVIRVYQANPGALGPGPLQVVHTVSEPVNFVYETDHWRTR